jgi:restriction system protein
MENITIILGLIFVVDAVLVAQMIFQPYKPKFRYRTLLDRDLLMIEQKISTLEGRDFELLCGFIFEKLGYKTEVTPAEGDGGKDIILNNEIFVECKRWSSTTQFVGREILQKLIGSCAGEGKHNAICIAWGGFNENAYEYAKKMEKLKEFNLVLYTRADVMDMIKKIDTTEVMKFLGFGYKYWNKQGLELVKNNR